MTPQIQTDSPMHLDDLAAAEADLAKQETALEEQGARMRKTRTEVSDKLTKARNAAEDPALAQALGAIVVPAFTSRAVSEESMLARTRALAVRKGCVEAAREQLKAYQAELEQVVTKVRAEEQSAKTRASQRSAEVQAAIAATKARAAAEVAAIEAAAAKVTEENGGDSLEASMMRALDTVPEKRAQVKTVPMAPAPKHDDRRSVQRVQLCAEISLGSDSNIFTGFTNDVSEGGVFVATVNVLKLGTPIDFTFTLPGGHKVEGRGEVRWVREFDERNPEVFPGMGIRFTDIPLPSVGAINAFTQQRDPMFFPEA